jgi:pimeloyl-ACP methyl ester carboxylesterase
VKRWSAVLLLVLLAGCGGNDAPTAKPRAAATVGRLLCTGSGSPTVVFESGLGVEPRATWAAVAPQIAKRTRVCIHERPGTGSSPPVGHSRTAAAVEHELEQLLHDRPVVLVGASFGGYVVQLYASRHPGDVSGVVLVDSLHPDIDRTFARLFGKRAAAARARQLAGNSEQISFKDLVASAHEVAAAKTFPAVPLVVLKHGISFDPGGDPDPALERAWGRMQRELAARSPEGRLVVAARSHHRIAEDQPELVVRAIEQVSG